MNERALKTTAAWTIFCAFCVSALMWLVAKPAALPQSDLQFKYDLSLNILYVALLLIGALLFLLGLKGFKAKLKIAYSEIIIGVVLIGITSLQLPLIGLFNLSSSLWVKSGAIVLPYIVAGLIIYLGSRRYARLLDLTGALTKPWVVLPVVMAGVVLSIFLPHPPLSPTDELIFDSQAALVLWISGLLIAAALLLLRLKKASGPLYTPSLAWLSLAFLFSAGFGVQTVLFDMLGVSEQAATIVTFALEPINGMLYVIAGYMFARITAIS